MIFQMTLTLGRFCKFTKVTRVWVSVSNGVGGFPQLPSDAFGGAGFGRGRLSHVVSVLSLCCLWVHSGEVSLDSSRCLPSLPQSANDWRGYLESPGNFLERNSLLEPGEGLASVQVSQEAPLHHDDASARYREMRAYKHDWMSTVYRWDTMWTHAIASFSWYSPETDCWGRTFCPSFHVLAYSLIVACTLSVTHVQVLLVSQHSPTMQLPMCLCNFVDQTLRAWKIL